MNMFLESFSDSLHIYKIPKPISYTKNTLIMTYESSTKFEDIECSEYIRSKIIRFLAIFFWNSHLHNICHEDIHKGNWGVQLNENKIKLVIYDYGLCARLLGRKTILFELLQNIFVDNGDTRKDIDAKILDNIKDLIHICVNDIEKEIVSRYIDNIFKDKSMLIPDAKVYVTKPFDLKVLKNDLHIYIESDKDIIDSENKIIYLETTTKYIDYVLKSIQSRGWDIKNAIEWKKFEAGMV